jgi:hypothetical protein
VRLNFNQFSLANYLNKIPMASFSRDWLLYSIPQKKAYCQITSLGLRMCLLQQQIQVLLHKWTFSFMLIKVWTSLVQFALHKWVVKELRRVREFCFHYLKPIYWNLKLKTHLDCLSRILMILMLIYVRMDSFVL